MSIDPILVLTTGGTIDKQYFDALSKYQITDSIVTRLLEVARVRHPYQVEEVLRKDSIDITEEDRGQIVEHVRRATLSRIVITHGTDTMTVTAAALNLGMAFATAQAAAPGVYIAINGSVFRGDEVIKNHDLGYFTRKAQR
jgi:L-asparaginase